MKRALVFFPVIAMMLSSVFFVNASVTPVVYINGPGVLRAGSNLVLTFKIGNATNILGGTLNLNYDKNRLTYISDEPLKDNWEIQKNEVSSGVVRIIFSDTMQEDPLENTENFMRVTFKVKSGIPAGTEIEVMAYDITVSDGDASIELSDSYYSVDISPPLSNDNALGSLVVSNADISPAFSSSVVDYSANVPFTVSSLNISALAEDPDASVAISGNDLAVGGNKVYITVRAQSGAERIYTITVTREQDPDYIPSDNTALSSLVPDKGILSPSFDPDIRDYTVFLPYEITVFKAAGIPQDIKAQNIDSKEIQLNDGANEYIITVTAEDGSTGSYSITVYRMAEDFSGTFAETGFDLYGRLMDSSGKPLIGETLEIQPEGRKFITKEDGSYFFKELTEGEYIFSIEGKEDFVISFTNGDRTIFKDGVAYITGDTVMDITVNEGLNIHSIRSAGDMVLSSYSKDASFGNWIYYTAIAAAAMLGGAAGWLLAKAPGRRKEL